MEEIDGCGAMGVEHWPHAPPFPPSPFAFPNGLRNPRLPTPLQPPVSPSPPPASGGKLHRSGGGALQHQPHPTGAVSVGGAESSLRVSRCNFVGGAEIGVVVGNGAMAELVDCALAVTTLGKAVSSSWPGSSVVLRGCRIEGCATAGGQNA